MDWFRVLGVWEKLPNSMRKVGDMIGIEEGFIVKAMTGTSFSMSSDVCFNFIFKAIKFNCYIVDKS